MVDSGETNKVVSMRFNQDQSCFVCGTEKGFQVYNCFPYKDTFQRVLGGGLGSVEMLFKTNVLGLVGGGTHPKYPLNKVMLWDDHQAKCIGELSFKTPVKSVKLRKDKVVIILETRIYVYNFADFHLLDAIDTCPNPRGACALTGSGPAILATPTTKKGELRIKNYDKSEEVVKKAAHESTLVAIVLSQDGKLCATASKKGTLIRIFSTENGRLLQELRRGKDKAEIYCLAFDHQCQWIACTSSKGTVHIFTVLTASKAATLQEEAVADPFVHDHDHEERKEESKEPHKDPKNRTSVFKFMKGIVPYFSSEWSLAQFRIPECRAIVGFGPEERNCVVGTDHDISVVVLCENGKYYAAEFDPKLGGECKKVAEHQIFLQE